MDRLTRVRNEMARRQLEGLLIYRPENRAYVSGFTGDAPADGFVLITHRSAHLATDARYTEQAGAEAPQFAIHEVKNRTDGYAELFRRLLAAEGVERLGFESDFMPVDTYTNFAQRLEGIELVPAGGLVEKVREIKDPGEVEIIRRAARLNDLAFDHILSYIRPGISEREIGVELEFFLRRHGAQGNAFSFIVASGPRSSLPHGTPSDRVIGPGELVTLDFGCIVDGYCSDMTRTVMVGEPDARQREIYEIVLEAQQRGVAAARPGISGRELDAVCRGYIAERGYGEAFGHSTGHGVGREIHEPPRISVVGETPLAPGHVITIEPGIYLPGWGGVRIEDLVLITEDGCERLSQSPKELIILE